MTDSDLNELKDFLIELAAKSAEVILPHYANPGLAVDTKSNDTPVTVADRDAEAVMREKIMKHYPSHGIIGEEYGEHQPDAEYVWSLDPIDGTISFTHGCPLFGTLIGLLHRGVPVLGAINQPVLTQLMIGDGNVTSLNGRTVTMRSRPLEKAALFTTDVDTITRERGSAGFETLRASTHLFRTWGDCYGYLLLAAGFGDIMLDGKMNSWDLVPLIPVIQGAGGIITAWDGSPALGSDSCVAAGAGLHSTVIGMLARGGDLNTPPGAK